ncbi:conjugative transposon protein TraM [Mucilaginibacter ximonensis]|uniref:Conjugative transposon protein TraM n=1 Tax=Mucilaginibacter ximonensis TaxID=538021 RepID=A0ABW5YAK4_9SPHI
MEKQRKFYLVIPLLVIPFLTMAFWALGGGQTKADRPTAAKGIDMTLPEAQFKKDEQQNKLAVYQASMRDSAQNGVSPSFLKAMGMHNDSASADQSAERIETKLAQLNKQMNQPPAPAYDPQVEATEQKIRQLHQMVKSAKSGRSEEDPEMAQLSKMLTQIQQIQNPGSVKVEKKPEDNTPFKAIPAVIDGKQKVMDGAAVRLKLTDSVLLKDQWIPKGQQIFGVCSVTNQRLLLNIQNIRLAQQIIPVSLTVFSLDGMPGIPAPEAELGGAAAGGADNALQSMQFMTMDQTIGAQAAAGGINAAKGLFSKKIKKIKVKLADQFPVLLKINK